MNNYNEIAKAINDIAMEAAAEAAASNVFYGAAVGSVNGHKVSVAALYATGKVNFRKPRITWMIDDKRCKAADVIAAVSA